MSKPTLRSFRRLPPAGGSAGVELPPFNEKMVGPLLDMALGMTFVKVLRDTGVRDALIKMLFEDKPVGSES